MGQGLRGGEPGVIVPARDGAQFRHGKLAGDTERPVNDRPPDMDRLFLVRRKGAAREPGRGAREFLGGKSAEISGEEADFAELAGGLADSLADGAEALEALGRTVPQRRGLGSVALAGFHDGKLQLIGSGERPGIDAASPEVAGKLLGKAMQREHAAGLHRFHELDEIVVPAWSESGKAASTWSR